MTRATAQGSYNAFLLDQYATDTLQRMQMGLENTNYTFTGLSQGDYKVYLTDANGCDQNAAFEKTIKPISVLQPNDTVGIFINGLGEATGYGRWTGWAETGFRGGSGNYTISWKNQNDADVTSLPFTTIGNTTFSKAENLPTDTYHVRVEDQNYSLAYPKTLINTRGCVDTISLFIDQPPKIEVELTETHVVTCYGDQDGEIKTHAVGGRPFTNGLPYEYQWFSIENEVDVPIGGNDSILTDIYSGYYKVKVTDRNNIDTMSFVFHLVQPDTMAATALALNQVLCDGDKSGRAEAFVTGGTAPYTYQWTTGETTKIVENLERNIYTVFVRDSRIRCTAEAHVTIKSPDGIIANAVLTAPSCHGYTDGKIELTIAGGEQPYRLLWENDSQEFDRTNLPEGEYKLIVTDANDCAINESYILTEPEEIQLSLGKDITLCMDQEVWLIANTNITNPNYEWSNGTTNNISNEAELKVNSPDTYTLKVTTPEGCFAEDEINIKQSDEVLKTDFLISSVIPRGKQIHALNIIKTEVDSIEWIIPDGVFVYENTADEISLMFPENGEYSIGLNGYLGECRDLLFKTVIVVSPSEIEEYVDSEPFLKRFVVSPNPNDGNFSVYVELREEASYTLSLLNELGALLDSKQIVDSEKEETVFLRNDLTSGIYYLRFVSGEHVSIFKIIIK